MTGADSQGSLGPRSPGWLVGFGIAATVLFAVLVALGTWQVERRAWKLALIERVETRVYAPPVPAPGRAEWPAITAADHEYRRVSVTGTFLNDRETLVAASTVLGPGSWVLTPLRRDDGTVVLVNRGFVPPARRDPATRTDGQVGGQIGGSATVTGLLRISEPGGAMLRANDPAADRWFSRDVAAIAAARRLEEVAPYFIDAEAAPGGPAFPVGGLTVIAFPNNHLVYAITWYGLAVMVAGGAACLIRQEWRARRQIVPLPTGERVE